jgi:Lrp/AsnC family transcriptional regulator, leucine-responsive regulatory protein
MTKSDAPLDALDRKILAHYQRDTRAAADKIGRLVGLSAAAVQRRLKRMRTARIILSEVALLAPERLGYPVTCIVGVRLEREGRAENARFTGIVTRYERVQQCYGVTGEFDFVLVVLARDIDDFESFARQALYDEARVKSFTTFVCLSRAKVGLLTPIDRQD